MKATYWRSLHVHGTGCLACHSPLSRMLLKPGGQNIKIEKFAEIPKQQVFWLKTLYIYIYIYTLKDWQRYCLLNSACCFFVVTQQHQAPILHDSKALFEKIIQWAATDFKDQAKVPLTGDLCWVQMVSSKQEHPGSGSQCWEVTTTQVSGTSE